MTRPTHDRAARSDPLAQIAQRVRTYVSKTDQTAQSDQQPENTGEFGALFGLELTSPHQKLTSGTAANRIRHVLRRPSEQSRASGPSCEASAMSALPLIEAVERAGGAITLHGDRLRLSAPEPLPENLLQELRTRKAEVIDHLQHARHSRLGQPAAEALTNCTAPPVEMVAAWAEGVARLGGILPPRHYPEHAWRQLIIDAGRFLDSWAAQAAAFGWPGWELFGCHRRAPWGRIQAMGLVLLLRGDEIAALTETEAVIRTQTGARQTYHRQPRDPLHPAERGLVWEVS